MGSLALLAAVILSNSFPISIYLSIYVWMYVCEQIFAAVAAGQPDAAWRTSSVAYDQTAGVRNIFPNT